MADLPVRSSALPTPADLDRWVIADRVARPTRLARLRADLAASGVDAWFGVRREDIRYLTGFVLAEGEDQMAGDSGRTLVGADEVVVLADTRYRVQAHEQATDCRIEDTLPDLPGRWPSLLASIRPISASDRVRRVAIDPGTVSHATWMALGAAAPDVELVQAPSWLREARAIKEPSEIERIGAACAVADAALHALLPSMRPGARERDLALDLEWAMRTTGAEALAFPVTCLSGPRAALPHGAPSDRVLRAGEVVLFDFGAQVAGYRSDMTRTMMVGEADPRDVAIHGLVARAQEAAFAALAEAATAGEPPRIRDVDAAARDVIGDAGHAAHFGHGLGHGIGLATHEAPSIGPRAPDVPLASPTVTSVEPGVYLDGETGVRIEDLVLFDAAARTCVRLTSFPREPLVVGT